MQHASRLGPVERTGAPPAGLEGGKRESKSPRARPQGLSAQGWRARGDVLIVGLAAIVGSALGRGIASALPGSSAGIEPLIAGVERVAEFSSQFLVMLGTATSVRLLLSTLEAGTRLFRPVAIISCAAALPVIISASSRQLEPTWLVALAALSGLLALSGASLAVRAPQSRALGLVLLSVTAGSLVMGSARVLALYASQHADGDLFDLARAIATAGLLLDASSVALGLVWLGRRLRAHGIWVAGALVSLAAVLARTGVSGDESVAWQVVVARALDAFTAHPDPFIGAGFRYFVEVLALLLASVALWIPRPVGVGAALAFALLARVSGDVPLCALMLILAALAAASASAGAQRTGSAMREPPGHRAALEVVPATR